MTSAGPGGRREVAFGEGRLGGGPAEVVIEHSRGPLLRKEAELFDAAVLADRAYTVMLAAQGIISSEDARGILSGLRRIAEQGIDGLDLEPGSGTLVLQIERRLAADIGIHTAGRVHTGRSRNDHSSAVDRLGAREELLAVAARLVRLQEVLLELARGHTATLMPGYTHLQRAQPITLAHYLLRFSFVLERDQQRLEQAYARTNLSALGSAAMGGTSWPVDRELIAALLGHEGLVANAMDAGVFARDYPAENTSVLSLLLSGIGRLAGDLYLWSSSEFGFIEVADGLGATSSIMPQKKNPHALERIRSLCGSSIGWLPTVLACLRSASSTDLDLYFARDLLPDAAGLTIAALELQTAVLETMDVRADVMEREAGADWSTATGLADELVRVGGLSFREAHQVVGRLVRTSIARGLTAEDVTAPMVAAAAAEVLEREVELPEETVRRSLDAEHFVAALRTRGGASAESVETMIEQASSLSSAHARWHHDKVEGIAAARAELDERVALLLRSGEG